MNRTLLIALFIAGMSFQESSAQGLIRNRIFRIIAFKRGNNAVTSMSNHKELIPSLKMYIPNAFTPNGDGLNEYGSYTAVSRDGTLTFVGGSAQRVTGNQRDMLVIAYEAATGTQKWVRRIAAPGDFSARVYGIVASPTADLLFVTGPRGSATTNNDWLTLALSTTTGATVWSRTFGGPDLLDDVAYAINVGPSGGQVYVTGDQQFGSGGSGIRTIAYKAATGTTVWSRLLGNAGSSGFGASVAVAPSGSRVFVGGQYVPDTATDPRAMVTAYAAGDGAPLWTRRVAAAPELPPDTNPYDLF